MTSNDVGKDTERAVVSYLREAGWPGAERTVRTGYRVHGRESADQGDITGCVGVCWQVKSLRPATRAELAIPGWLRDTEAQRVASGASLGFLVVRRWGTADVGRWWAFQHLGQLTALSASIEFADSELHVYAAKIPVRMDMASLTGLLHEAGWADSSAEEAS